MALKAKRFVLTVHPDAKCRKNHWGSFDIITGPSGIRLFGYAACNLKNETEAWKQARRNIQNKMLDLLERQ